MRHLVAAALVVAFGSADPAHALNIATCVTKGDDGKVTTARLFRPEFEFADPTREYDHAVLGDDIEYRSLRVARFPASRSLTPPEGVDTSNLPDDTIFEVTLPEGRVFEDLVPRAFDWTSAEFHRRSGVPELGLEIAVVETDMARGASLAIYRIACDGLKKVAATEEIGQAHRWLAPAAIADFDGDGTRDIAYVETPHLSGTLRIVTLRGRDLVEIVPAQAGFSNHRIGDDFITSAVHRCDGLPTLVLPDRDWTALMAVQVMGGEIVATPLDEAPTPDGIARAVACD